MRVGRYSSGRPWNIFQYFLLGVVFCVRGNNYRCAAVLGGKVATFGNRTIAFATRSSCIGYTVGLSRGLRTRCLSIFHTHTWRRRFQPKCIGRKNKVGVEMCSSTGRLLLSHYTNVQIRTYNRTSADVGAQACTLIVSRACACFRGSMMLLTTPKPGHGQALHKIAAAGCQLL